jgi:hypothetical protein
MKFKGRNFNRILTLYSLLVLVLAVSVGACTSAQRSKTFGYGNNYHVQVWSGGQAVRDYHSNGKVLSEDKSDGYYFTNRANGKLVEVAGIITIEEE